MIDQWRLPMPAMLVNDVVADLLEGRHILLGSLPGVTGLRAAVEDALQVRQIGLRQIFDRDTDSPDVLLRRACSDGVAPAKIAEAGIYWVGDIPAHRAVAWTNAMSEIANAQRSNDPWERVQIVAEIPAHLEPRSTMDIIHRSTAVLSRLDLEVFARYAIGADRGDPRSAIRAALAIELSQSDLPGFAALARFAHWLTAPPEAMRDGTALREHDRAGGFAPPTIGRAEVALWRAQQSVLVGMIDDARLEILSHRQFWWLPFTPLRPDGTPGREIVHCELLELTHLCDQARQCGIRWDDPLMRRLHALRAARNAISHLDVLRPEEIDNIILSATGN